MICAITTNGHLALLLVLFSVLIFRILALQTFQLRTYSDRRLKQKMNRFTNEIDSPPSIDRPPPEYTVFDVVQLAQDGRIAFSPLPPNYKPKVPHLPPPKRSPGHHSFMAKVNRGATADSRRVCREESRWEKLSQGTNFHAEEVDVYEGQWFWVTRCVEPEEGGATGGVQECYGVQPLNGIVDATCLETKAWVLAYSRLKTNPTGEFSWDYIAVPNCCSCKVQELPGEKEFI